MFFKDNFFFGVGLKNYRVVCDFQTDPRPDHPAQFCSTHPHNFLLEILSETGFIGFIIFYIFFISLILGLVKFYNKNFKENKIFTSNFWPCFNINKLYMAFKNLR